MKSKLNFHKNISAEDEADTSEHDHLVDYYCKLTSINIHDLNYQKKDVSLSVNTGYAFDFYRVMANFPKKVKFNYLWGDVVHVPESPTFVKSRPIIRDNQNSVLLPLDSYRHFHFVDDPLGYDKKKSKAVWRGAVYQKHREEFLKAVAGLDFCDVADTSKDALKNSPENYMSISDQLLNKVIFSIEGNDVATNLKWIMFSNSLCFSPKLKFETWYCEGLLKPFVHYVELRDDFSDVREKFEHYMSHPDEAKKIISNAQSYARLFLSEAHRYAVAKKVVSKYLILSNQKLDQS
jgi:Glycosyl transferase family 90